MSIIFFKWRPQYVSVCISERSPARDECLLSLSLRICNIKLMNVHSSTENQLEQKEKEAVRAPWGGLCVCIGGYGCIFSLDITDINIFFWKGAVCAPK